MSRIRSTNTKAELLVRKFLHVNGFRYQLYDKSLPKLTANISRRKKWKLYLSNFAFDKSLLTFSIFSGKEDLVTFDLYTIVWWDWFLFFFDNEALPGLFFFVKLILKFTYF
jgi:hypothetical protein